MLVNKQVRPMKEGVERGCRLGGGRLEYEYWAWTNNFITLLSPSVLIYNIKLAALHQVPHDYSKGMFIGSLIAILSSLVNSHHMSV